jgi:hypothetical protein
MTNAAFQRYTEGGASASALFPFGRCVCAEFTVRIALRLRKAAASLTAAHRVKGAKARNLIAPSSSMKVA